MIATQQPKDANGEAMLENLRFLRGDKPRTADAKARNAEQLPINADEHEFTSDPGQLQSTRTSATASKSTARQPLAKAAYPSRSSGPTASRGPKRAPGNPHAMTVVIAEDDTFLRSLMVELLTSQGYRVLSFSGGDEAVAAADQIGADILITDILMEEGEGISTIMKMRKALAKIGIIAVSTNERYLTYAEKIGADCVMRKPLKSRALLQAIKKVQQCPRNDPLHPPVSAMQ